MMSIRVNSLSTTPSVAGSTSGFVLLTALLFGVLAFAGVQDAAAAGIRLAWDAVPDNRVDHYELHYGRATGQYDSQVDTVATALDLPDMQSGATYYFAVRACDQPAASCSDFSSEISAAISDPAPLAALTANVVSGVVPLTVTFSDQSSGTVTGRAWDFGDGGTSTAATAVYTYSAPGSYTVGLTVTGPGGTSAQIAPAFITVSAPPPVAGFVGDVLTGTAPLTVGFQDLSTGPVTAWNWSFGDGSTSPLPQASHLYTQPGLYVVALTVSGPGGGNTLTRNGYVQVLAPLPPPPPAVTLPLEIGDVLITDAWQRVDFQHTFADPIVVLKSLSYNDTDSALIRVKGIDAKGFWVRVQEWDYLDGGHAAEAASYLAMERGTHQLPDGVWVEAGSVTTSATNAFQYQAFSKTFTNAPVVFAAVTTVNEAQAVNARLNSITTKGFFVGMREQESNQQKHSAERIDYIAWEVSSGLVAGLRYEVGRTGNTVTNKPSRRAFQSVFQRTPVLLGDMQTVNEGDAAGLRWSGLYPDMVDLWVQEEQSKDKELNHAAETVGYFLADVE